MTPSLAIVFFMNKNVFRSTYPWYPQKWKLRPPQPQKWWLTWNNEWKCHWKWPHYHPRHWSHYYYCPPSRCQPKERPRPLPPRSLNVSFLFHEIFSSLFVFTRFFVSFRFHEIFRLFSFSQDFSCVSFRFHEIFRLCVWWFHEIFYYFWPFQFRLHEIFRLCDDFTIFLLFLACTSHL